MSVEQTAAVWWESAAVWGFVGTLVGAAASIAGALLSSWFSQRADSERDKRHRAQRAQDFQLETILRIQEEILKLRNISGDVLNREIARDPNSVRWRMRPTEEFQNVDQLEVDWAAALRTCSSLIERVQDDALRERLSNFVETIVKMINARSRPQAEALQKVLSEEIRPLINEMGVHIRSHAFYNTMPAGRPGGCVR